MEDPPDTDARSAAQGLLDIAIKAAKRTPPASESRDDIEAAPQFEQGACFW